MRIISGDLGSRKIKTLKSNQTRPTSDRVKEAMFSKIGPFFDGGRILDVFAGSGAIAFEALSRGMEHADLIEKSRKAVQVINQNIKDLHLNDRTSIHFGDARAILKTIKNKYDIIFVDPPYAFEDYDNIVYECSLLLKDEKSLLIVEADVKRTISVSKEFELFDKKQYGNTNLHYIRMR